MRDIFRILASCVLLALGAVAFYWMEKPFETTPWYEYAIVAGLATGFIVLIEYFARLDGIPYTPTIIFLAAPRFFADEENPFVRTLPALIFFYCIALPWFRYRSRFWSWAVRVPGQLFFCLSILKTSLGILIILMIGSWAAQSPIASIETGAFFWVLLFAIYGLSFSLDRDLKKRWLEGQFPASKRESTSN